MLTLLRATPVWASGAPKSVQNRGIDNWQRQYYAENFARLVRVKTKYDPHNLFHNAQSIPARPAHARPMHPTS
jgi:berberine-like enzyme